MRIAFITTTFKPELNGVSDSVYARALVLGEAGHKVLVIIPDYSIHEQYYPDYAEYCGTIHPNVTVKQYPTYPMPGKFDGCAIVPFFKYRFETDLGPFQPDIIHIDEPYRLVGLRFTDGYLKRPVLGYARRFNIPVTVMWHTQFFKYAAYYLSRLENSILTPIVRRRFVHVYNSYDLTLCHSRYVQKIIEEMGVKNAVFDHFHGIDLERFHQKGKKERSGPFRLLFAGRIEPEKELDVLFEAFHQVRKIHKDAELILAGHGTLEPELHKRHEQDPGVCFKGLLTPEKLADLYREMDLFVTPSTTETFGNTVIEASASGLPVVGPREGGLLDTIQEGINGFYFEPHNADDMARQINRLLSNNKLRQSLCESSPQTASFYSHETAAMTMLHYFEKLLQLKGQKCGNFKQVISRSVST
jgi:glycosyltransferase involved in cell wall biosynthesis